MGSVQEAHQPGLRLNCRHCMNMLLSLTNLISSQLILVICEDSDTIFGRGRAINPRFFNLNKSFNGVNMNSTKVKPNESILDPMFNTTEINIGKDEDMTKSTPDIELYSEKQARSFVPPAIQYGGWNPVALKNDGYIKQDRIIQVEPEIITIDNYHLCSRVPQLFEHIVKSTFKITD